MDKYLGKLLISSPMLEDPNFRQTVVLMIGDNSNGHLGLILNRWADKRVSELWESIFNRSTPGSQIIHLGGPVFGPLMILHTCAEHADQEILPGLFFSTRKEFIEDIVDNNLEPFKLFVGNAGWGRIQLQREIEEGCWFVLPGKFDYVFGDDAELWSDALFTAGRPILKNVLHLENIPDDPELN